MVGGVRVPPVEPGTDPRLLDLEELIRAERGGELPKLYKVLLNSPPVAAGWEQLLTAVRTHCELPARLRELMILRVAVLNNASFEFAAHEPHARAAGVSEETISAVGHDALIHGALTEQDLLVLSLTDQMTQSITVPENLILRLREDLGDRATVEAVATVAAYNMVSRFLVALNIVHEHEHEDEVHR